MFISIHASTWIKVLISVIDPFQFYWCFNFIPIILLGLLLSWISMYNCIVAGIMYVHLHVLILISGCLLVG